MASVARNYFEKHAFYPPLIQAVPAADLIGAIVIPVLREPNVIRALESLAQCQPPPGSVEIIVVINHSEDADQESRNVNAQTRREVLEWSHSKAPDYLPIQVLWMPDLPAKKAGVGLARKIGMDEACHRLSEAGANKGFISCFDADCTCAPNYLTAVTDFFRTNPEQDACSIYFEHPLEGLRPSERRAIIEYELHLRYFIAAQRFAGFPFAYQTVGSSMAVRADAYQALGGMNTRQAGEDFYFLQKFIERGSCANLTSTTVYPSARISDRVPFGTGKAVAEAMRTDGVRLTYALEHFQDLCVFLAAIPGLYLMDIDRDLDDWLQKLPGAISSYLRVSNVKSRIAQTERNTSSKDSFVKRFLRWFNAFRLMKYLHFARTEFYPDVPVTLAAAELLANTGERASDAETLLKHYRTLARKETSWTQ